MNVWNRGALLAPPCLMSATTPITVNQGASGLPPKRMRRPSALCPGQVRRARASFTTTTGAGSRPSKLRPVDERDAHRLEVAGTDQPVPGRVTRLPGAGGAPPSAAKSMSESPSASGVTEVSAARVTPGTAATCCSSRSCRPTQSASSRYLPAGTDTVAVSTFVGLNPRSVRCIARKLRSSKPLPASSTIATATSTTTSPRRRR